MNRLGLLPVLAAAVLVAAAPADAAKKSCNAGGAITITSQGDVSVVYVHPKETHKEQPQDIVYGCWVPSGKRTKLFSAFLDDESDAWSIVGGRYIGDFSAESEGVSGHSSATTWDARTGKKVHDTAPCDNVQVDPSNDENPTGPDAAVFFEGGGIAYTCGAAHIVDANGDRALEPAGTSVTGLAVTPAGDRLYYLAGDTPKSVSV
jgi:hypothetical protein